MAVSIGQRQQKAANIFYIVRLYKLFLEAVCMFHHNFINNDSFEPAASYSDFVTVNWVRFIINKW